jgi:hypothetical protein
VQQDEGDAAARPQQDQTSYIMTLEQENMALKQQNQDLQEVCSTIARDGYLNVRYKGEGLHAFSL